MDRKNLPVVICYPPGAGGSMLASVLHCAFSNDQFEISPTGHCHHNWAGKITHMIPTSDVQGFRNELDVIESCASMRSTVISGHLRNLVAMQSVRYDFWFIKIVFDTDCHREVEFLHRMLAHKVSLTQRLQDCYSQIRFDDWPKNFNEFLDLPNNELMFKEQNTYTLKNWFWVESPLTRDRTLELSLQDVFLGIPSEKLSQWYDQYTVDKIYPMIKAWQTVNQDLYPETMALLKF